MRSIHYGLGKSRGKKSKRELLNHTKSFECTDGDGGCGKIDNPEKTMNCGYLGILGKVNCGYLEIPNENGVRLPSDAWGR